MGAFCFTNVNLLLNIAKTIDKCSTVYYLCQTNNANNNKMKAAQLIKVTEVTLYLKDGIVCETPISDIEKIQHCIFGETKIMRTEEVVIRFRAKNNKELNEMFWNYIESESLESRDYYLVIDSN